MYEELLCLQDKVCFYLQRAGILKNSGRSISLPASTRKTSFLLEAFFLNVDSS